MKIVHFYEIGAYKGRTLEIAREQLDALGDQVKVRFFAFECYPVYVKMLRKKFRNDERIAIIPKAIWSGKGKAPFYLSTVNKVGHSMYPGKTGVDKEHPIEVPTILFSDWYAKITEVPHIRIMNVNIEGAEVNLFKDLMVHNLVRDFALYLFSDDEPYPVDVFKVDELKPHAKRFIDTIRRLKLRTGKLHHVNVDGNFPIAEFVAHKLGLEPPVFKEDEE